MNQTSTAAAIATMIAAYTGLFAMIGFLLFVTRSKAMPPRTVPRASTTGVEAGARPELSTTVGGSIASPRSAADDVVKVA
jgi:hypothetical protein